MDTYSTLTQFAESWVLLGMFLFYVGAIIWAFRPGSRKVHEDINQIPFRNDDGPGASKTEERHS